MVVGVIQDAILQPKEWALGRDSAHPLIPFFCSLELNPAHSDCVWAPPFIPESTRLNTTWCRTKYLIRLRTGQCEVFSILRSTRTDLGDQKSASDNPPAFNRLGISLWDFWRMYSLGLMPDPFRRKQKHLTSNGDFVEESPARERLSQPSTRGGFH